MPLLEEELALPDEDFTSVRIAEFYSPREVPFELFLRLGANQYLRIFREGEPYNEAELKSYEQDRGVRLVYFRKEKRNLYIKSARLLLQKIGPLAGVPLRMKFGVARILCELYLQELFAATDETRPALVERGKGICATIAYWCDNEPGLEDYLLKLDRIDPSVESLSFLSAIMAAALSKRFPWKSQRTTETLLLAGLFSDLGLVALPPEFLILRPKRMNGGQRKQYEKHPELSYLLLKELGSVREDVLLIVRQQHEYCDGSGFPQKVSGDKILQLAKLLCLSGDLVRCASEFLMPPADAANILFPVLSKQAFAKTPELVARYDKGILEVFFTAFQSAPGKGGSEEAA